MSVTKIYAALKNSPVGIMAAGIFSTFAIIGTYRFAIKPRLDRQRREEAEGYADYIFQQERSNATAFKQ